MTISKHTSEKGGYWPLTIAISAITFFLLWVLRTQQFTGDSLWYAQDALNGTQMFHPHHLLFTPLVHWLYSFTVNLNLGLNVLEVGQLINIGSASLIVGLIHRLLVENTSIETSSWAACLLVICNGFWTYSTQIEVYLPGILFSLVLMMTVSRTRSGLNTFLAIGSLALAALFHQTNVLLVVPMALVIGRNEWRRTLLICLSSGLFVLACYFLVMKHEGFSINPSGFVNFSLQYAVSGQHDWGTFSNWLPKGWFEMFGSQTGNIIRQSYAHVVVYWLIFTAGVLWLVVFAFRNLNTQKSHRPLVHFSFWWIITNYLFFLWWLPKESEFFIATLIPLIVLLAINVESAKWRYARFILPAVFLVVTIFNTKAFYDKHDKPNRSGLLASELAKVATDSTVVITDFFTEQYLEFFHGIRAENTDNIYREIYGTGEMGMVRGVAEMPLLIISDHHISREFMVNEKTSNINPAEWKTGMAGLLKNVCDAHSTTILNEPHWIIERCDSISLTIEEQLTLLGKQKP